MGSDEREIRELHSAWIKAVNAGDLARLLAWMTDDVVLLSPAKRRSAAMDFPPTSRPRINSFGSVAAAIWKKSSSSAKSLTRGAGTHCW